MILIGLAGVAGSGKDATADYLVQRYGFVKFSFSDALYREVAAAFDLPDESLLRDRETKEVATPLLSLEKCGDYGFEALVRGMFAPEDLTLRTPHSPRQILQWWGTEYRRAQDPDYWIARTEEWLVRVHEITRYPEHRPQLFVNTSVRFENERTWIHELEGNVWHLHRDAAAPVAGHVSETPLPVLENEREIFNNYTLDYLYKGVDQLLTSGAKFVRMEPPAPMVEPEPLLGHVHQQHQGQVVVNGLLKGPDEYAASVPPVGAITPAHNGMYYKVQPDGHNMLCNADGTRSIFDDVDE